MQQSHQYDIFPYDDRGRFGALFLFVCVIKRVFSGGLWKNIPVAGLVLLLLLLQRLRLRHRGSGFGDALRGKKKKKKNRSSRWLFFFCG